jgi:glycine cleavage system H protein
MAELPSDLLYTEQHEYLARTDEEGVYRVGITDYAQGELGDIVYVELPAAGASFGKGDSFGTVEAVKAVSDLYMPVAGEVVAVNDALQDDPALIKSAPYGQGFLFASGVGDAG